MKSSFIYKYYIGVLSYNSSFAVSLLQQSAFMRDMAYDRVSKSVTETAWTVKKP